MWKEQKNLPLDERQSAEKYCPNQTKSVTSYEVITPKNHCSKTTNQKSKKSGKNQKDNKGKWNMS